ncbi:MAG: hypothetical protein PWQ43_483 [Rikenellaceae bacterium]|nr:hypothetical protein [Rikenellaceae bacterium]MDN5355541.1 hypothetical protein [Rikenellaceae bacterium]
MKKVNYLFISLVFIFLSSCTSTHLTQKYNYLNKVPVNSIIDNEYTAAIKMQNQDTIYDNKLSNESINNTAITNKEIPNVPNKTYRLSTSKQINLKKVINSINPFTLIEANHFKQQLNKMDGDSSVDTNTLAKVLIGLLILSLVLVILDLILPGDVFSIISTIILILILIYGIYFLFQLL